MTIARPEISDDVIGILRAYKWPGNVRELENCIERAVTLSQGDMIQKQHLPIRIVKKLNRKGSDTTSIQDGYKSMIINALKRCDGNASQAARDLNIARSTLYRKMEEFAIKQ